jgi:hypothetical protein
VLQSQVGHGATYSTGSSLHYTARYAIFEIPRFPRIVSSRTRGPGPHVTEHRVSVGLRAGAGPCRRESRGTEARAM